MKRHFFFDMDGTLTRSRSEITEEMVVCLRALLERGGDVVVVSGATKEQIAKQIGILAREVIILAQNGNYAELPSGATAWRNELTTTQKEEVLSLVRNMIAHVALVVDNALDLVEDRICQISYSLIGHHALLESKEAADPDRRIRKELLARFSTEIARLNELGVQARIGGTTCIDFTTSHKGDNVKRFAEYMQWDRDECVYVGDALFEGGNDHSVVGVVATVAVESPKECEEVVRSFVQELRGF